LDPEKVGEEDWTVDTAFNVDGIVEHLNEKGYNLTQKSEDAGKYVCDYTYFTSLRESRLHTTSLGHPRKVLFIHVPTPPEPYKLDELCNLITDAITCLPKYE
jgi:pyroglutamyl-peptidase